MPVSLVRPYGAYPAGAIVSLPASTEAAIVQQNIGNFTAATPTAGNIASAEHQGRSAFAAGANSLTITSPHVNASSKVVASLNAAAADGTLTGITRVVPAAGSFTIYGNAAATGVVPVDWQITSTGLTPYQ